MTLDEVTFSREPGSNTGFKFRRENLLAAAATADLNEGISNMERAEIQAVIQKQFPRFHNSSPTSKEGRGRRNTTMSAPHKNSK